MLTNAVVSFYATPSTSKDSSGPVSGFGLVLLVITFWL